MKILHVIPNLRKGGAERLALDICRELQSRPGTTVEIIVFNNANGYPKLSENISISIIPSTVNVSVTGKNKVEITEFTAFVEKFKPDVIHSHLYGAEVVTREKTFPRIAYFSHEHANIPQLENFSVRDIFNRKNWLHLFEKKRLVKRYVECNNRFIAISKNTESFLHQVLPQQLQKNIHLLHNAVDFKIFNVANHPRQINKIKIVNAGSINANKNQAFLLEVAKVLEKRKANFEMVFLGTGIMYNEIKNRIAQLNLQHRISVPGNLENVSDFLASANLYVHTAKNEAFGLVLIEAMAAGLPVITSDGGGNRDLIEEGKNGFMIREFNAKLFADKILEVVSDEKRYKEMSEYCVLFASKFDIKNYVDKLLELYRAALAE